MPNPYFQFKQFTIHHDRCAMKVTTDACLFGAWVANDLMQQEQAIEMMDIGTGTGLLSLMIAQKNQLRTDAIEIDDEAASQAMENVQASPWKEKIHVIKGNILELASDKMYDIIVSNPPFYENELASSKKEKNKAHHSSELKLIEVMEVIKKRLKEHGQFYLLLPFKRGQEIEEMLDDLNFHVWNKIVVAPSNQHPPFRMMIKAGNKPYQNPEISHLFIRNEKEQYSDEFIYLLKDYYLYL